MSVKQAYEKKMQAQLDEWSAEIKKLKAKAEYAEADVEIKYHKQIEELQAMQKAASEKLTNLKDAGDDAWEELKVGIENSCDSLGSTLKSVSSKFR
ncbi:MAG: hypothetical protein RQ733_13375 [Methyloprofundus sp.]|nr:hypothetical protein [Methyloprofundus sp.]MDT8426954.1 hypothetical protein [Methyloprofundus sp.]